MNYTEFTIVRHGETDANRQCRIQSWIDTPLNENGLKQAEAVALYLKKRRFDAAFSSDLTRVLQTVRSILSFHPDVPLNPVKALREWNLGRIDGCDKEEIEKNHPELITSFLRETENTVFPGGESRMDFQKRIETFMTDIALKYPGKSILVGTHGGALQRIFRMAAGITAAGNILSVPDNASVNLIRFYHGAHGGWQLRAWNLCDHLNELEVWQQLTF